MYSAHASKFTITADSIIVTSYAGRVTLGIYEGAASSFTLTGTLYELLDAVQLMEQALLTQEIKGQAVEDQAPAHHAIS